MDNNPYSEFVGIFFLYFIYFLTSFVHIDFKRVIC